MNTHNTCKVKVMTDATHPPVEPCVLCGEPIEGHGHNPAPLSEGRCCDDCNLKVIVCRITNMDEWNVVKEW